MPQTPKFFITHSFKDNAFARCLTDDFRAHGLDGFFDVYSLKPGDMISVEISRGLEECDIYVPILSRAALKSPWCEEEINAAITLSKMPGRRGCPRIVPVLVEDCADEMPLFLRTRLYVKFAGRYDDALGELLSKGFGVAVEATKAQSLAMRSSWRTALIVVSILAGFLLLAFTGSKLIEILARPGIGSTKISLIDGATMAYVPAGKFTMGSNDYSDEKPPHTVSLDAFWIDKSEVTNALFKRCVEVGKCSAPSQSSSSTRSFYFGNSQFVNYPVIYVTWDDANKYCTWASKRLPTEAQWEKAARGTDGRVYPWGNTYDKNRLNAESTVGDTTEVGKFPSGASPYGALDMAGNVQEWVADWYDKEYYGNSPNQNPKGPPSGNYHILRGGSWYDGPANLHTTVRFPNWIQSNVYAGFRCAE